MSCFNDCSRPHFVPHPNPQYNCIIGRTGHVICVEIHAPVKSFYQTFVRRWLLARLECKRFWESLIITGEASVCGKNRADFILTYLHRDNNNNYTLLCVVPSIKYVTLEEEGGVREGVTVCDRGVQEHVTSCFKQIAYIWNLKLKVMFSFLL